MSAFEGLRMNDARSPQPSQTGSDPSNSRASSVVAAKISKASVVRKPRAAPKAPSKPRLSPKKAVPTAPPVPRVPSLFAKPLDGSTTTTEFITHEQRISQASNGTGGSVDQADEMNALAGSMNKLKIKLKVPSPEENAERERKAAASQTKPKTVKKPPIPKVTKVAKVPKAPRVTALNRAKTPTERSQQIEAREASFYNSEANAPDDTPTWPIEPARDIFVPDQPARTTDLLEPIMQTSTTSWALETVVAPQATVSPTTKPVDTDEESPIPSNHTATAVVDMPQPANLEHGSAVPTISPQDPTTSSISIAEQSHEKNSSAVPSTPSAAVKRTKADLPMFTSSSPIPFSMVFSNDGNIDLSRKENHVKDGQPITSDPEEGQVVKKAAPSIWDIPETPLPQR